ncbi:MAG TPA: YciI family protein [Aquihabitans sp.]|jgi:hypothetical protein|nr:YciI family protein [Aquihabitans sp.]
MDFVCLIYQGTTPLPSDPERWATLSEDEQQAIYRDYRALNATEGLTPGPPLGLPADATTVRVVDGEAVTTDGPVIGTDAAVGGYFVLQADDLAGAVAVAATVPAARLGGAIEIRPCATYW